MKPKSFRPGRPHSNAKSNVGPDLRHLRNPHSALAALKNRPNDCRELFVPDLSANKPVRLEPAWQSVFELAQEMGLSITDAPLISKNIFSSQGPNRGGRPHSGPELTVMDKQPIPLSRLLEGADEGGGGIWMALDCIQDPQNMGAIFRLAGFFGVRGILLLQDRSVNLTDVVYDVSCGGVECVPFAVEVNLSRSLEMAKERGFWILGTSEHAKESVYGCKLDRKWILVLGNEESGMRKLTSERCDLLVSLPAFGGVPSLNVATAAASILSHLRAN